MSQPLSAFIAAGEASGDQHAAALVHALARHYPLAWFGLGGDEMQAAGVELVEHARSINVLGIIEILAHVPRIYGVFRKLVREIERRRPRLAVLVDLPGFNLHLAPRLDALGIPVVYFIPPQLWAWRPWRVRILKRHVRKVLCIFSFEERFYQEAGLDVAYIGHPLVERAVPTMTRTDFFARHHLDARVPLVCLLPGSRNQEVARHLPRMQAAAELLRERGPVQFLVVRAPTVDAQTVRRYWMEQPCARVVEGPVYNALAASTAAVVSSGTATVEAVLLETPLVVVYQVAPLTWWLGRPLVRVPYYSMVNLIAGHRVVPELIQNDFTSERVADEISHLLSSDTAREAMKSQLRAVRARLGEPGAIERASRAILSLLPRPAPASLVS